MIVLGIDPGLHGALAVLDTDLGSISLLDTPTVEVQAGRKTRLEYADAAIADWIQAAKPDQAFLELVGAAPGQGVVSMFRFGVGWGVMRGILAASDIPVTFVTPQTWRRGLSVPEGKDGSRLRAAQLFPKFNQMFARKKDDGRAEAVLIATFGAMTRLTPRPTV